MSRANPAPMPSYFLKYETIVHWVPAFIMHNKSILGRVCMYQAMTKRCERGDVQVYQKLTFGLDECSKSWRLVRIAVFSIFSNKWTIFIHSSYRGPYRAYIKFKAKTKLGYRQSKTKQKNKGLDIKLGTNIRDWFIWFHINFLPEKQLW